MVAYSFLGIEIMDKVEVTGNLRPDSVAKNEDVLRRAFDDGVKIVGG